MRRSPLLFALLGSCGLCVAGAAQAGDKPLYQPAPTWIAPAPPIDATKLTDASPALVLLDSQQRVENGQVWSYFDTATRASSAQALSEIGDVKLQWQPAQGDLVIHRAEIIRGAQHIDLLANKQPFTVLRREEQLDQRQLDGALTAMMNAEGLSVGDVLHVSFSMTRRDPTLKGDAQLFAGLPTAPAQIGFGRVRVVWPETTDLKWRSYADGVTAKPVTKNGWRELTVPLPLVKQPEMPDDAPARFRKLPMLEATTFADWAAVSKVMAPLYATDGAIAPNSPLAAEVTRIKAAQAQPLARAALALQSVQDNIRYLVLGMDTGNYVPQPAVQTWEKRFGDCKAKTLLLLAMLHAMDIEAEPVLASARMPGLVADRLASAGAFDHVLVRATIDGESLWLDGTASGARLADIRDTPALGTVLPVRANGATLMPIALRPDARPTVTVSVDLDDRGGVDTPSIVKAEVQLRGHGADAIGAAAAQATPDQRREIAQRILSSQAGSGSYVDPKIVYDPAAGIATISATGIASTHWSQTERRYRLPLDTAVGKLDFTPDRARTAWSAVPVQLPGPAAIVYRTTFHLPDGGRGYTLEGDRTLPATLAGKRVARRVSMNGDTVVIEDRVDELGGEMAAADLPAVRAALAQARSRSPAVIAPAGVGGRAYWQAARQAGLHKPVDAMFARVIAADPKSTGNYAWRARFHNGSADRVAAAVDYSGAIAIEPSADLYLARASTYEQLGQDAKQFADIEAARKLDPENDEALGALANYQAKHGQGGAALALIDARLDRAGSKERPDWLVAKANAQSDSGQKEAALATLDGAIGEKPGNPALLNARCWQRGVGNVALEAALKDCTRSIELSDSTYMALDSRALIYYRMGRFDDALADLTAALEAEPDLSASRFMRGVVLHRTGKIAEGDRELALARLIDPQVDADYARWGIKP
jgi:tetratricopeptide (TPR) repeat protein/transglutaminase-like putative cysteine protease